MEYFENKDIPEDDRRNTAFQTVSAVRESVSVARRAPHPITYENALDLIYDLNPELYKSITTLLKNKNESDTVKFYKEKAEALSTEDEPVAPVSLIEADLADLEIIVGRSGKKKFLRKKVFDLKAALEYFKPRAVSEHKVLNHDYFLATRDFLSTTNIYQNDLYKDYRLADKRILRLRLLHPDQEEAILGTDLIYEQFDLAKERVRFAHLQYKMWNSNTLYFNQGSLDSQINKMESNLCKGGFCLSETGQRNNTNYRLPFCSAFLRPTSKIQSPESKLVTTGIHLPICMVQQIKNQEKKLTKKNSAEISLSQKIFEELFVNNNLGSRWIPIDKLEEFYNSKNIPHLTDSIRIHVQEVIIQTEEEKHREE